ncbi:CRISPR-associated protein Cas4 [Ethanoligenens harbinense]|uniref:CRISPR-associated exonuclease Cas4 n=1 Tax=Ethanoligenens harbinense (strain DSM 18485 / JCM 12961 / CGMCC 1.5033 / YUAN-3) TaxID=663278 RepID=E6U9V2_ETHHY|nr:CRISPR-associated protein Cas4 [Ethanoligenens harbinense]ADU26218.1 CRISPR-associated protein Cas4 [Ethanoligenens harbinense YUAN-3]AVQ95354.1 CRISPR-associated protein Cas4 [Ethanoligenens harbinense YUAN-3]AYF38020.1 CRISPR-associated protein Cas4 [Ethanoligenens harbinense]AYF40765.1 CRISPR-associated protein Cas4 [Ethanoligenens harbinense]QCN91596.1 CRISPR-associated protein Cas4 [Ethanoligenens harbinense]
MAYEEDAFLNLAGIQHFAFCRRQWALAYIEMQWAENLRTTEGHLLHERAHDAFATEKRGNLLISRGMSVFSRELGINGVCDVVEFHASARGVPLFGREGKWLPVPVEYKRGSPKENDADRLQLCAQAMCLEEMLVCDSIPQAYLYYGETARRSVVALDDDLRQRVRAISDEMHELYRRQYTPRVKPTRSCNACSLKELCLPKLQRVGSAAAYLRKRLEEVP